MYSDYESVFKESGTHLRQVEVLYLNLPFYLYGTKLFESCFKVQYLRDATPLLLQEGYGTDKIRMQ